MIEFATAVERVKAAMRVLEPETVALAAGAGGICAQSIQSGIDLPPFANSAMDGFALRRSASAGENFAVSHSQAAGDRDAQPLGDAIEIMTGAKVPAGFTTVVPVENTRTLEFAANGKPARIELTKDLAADANVRHAGEDVKSGELIVASGTRLAAPHLMQLASIGATALQIRRRPRIRIVNTGAELAATGDELGGSMIHNSNGPYLAQRVLDAGAVVHARHTVSDDPTAFHDAVMHGPNEDIVISTGAVSMGRFDFIPQWLQDQGAVIHFHKVAQRPGKPVLFATLRDGRHFFGLPGNPASVAACFRFYVEPAVRAMLGLNEERALRLPLQETFFKKAALAQMLKARAELVDGQLQVRILSGQESFKVQPLLSANAWAWLPADKTGEITHADVVSATHLQDISINHS